MAYRRSKLVLKRSLMLGACLAPVLASADINYTIKPDVPNAMVRVGIKLEAESDVVQFKLPAWDPGYYLILNNQEKIGGFTASDADGHPLKTQHTELRTWTVYNPEHKPMSVHYNVLGDDAGLGFFAVHMDEQTGFINGPAAFMYVDGRKDERDTLDVELPQDWSIATAMDESPDHTYFAQGYDEFVDHPIQMGHFVDCPFVVEGIPFDAVFVSTSGYQCDPKVEAAKLQELAAPAIRLFKGASFKRYLFIVHLAVGSFAGGLEHRASNVEAIANSANLNLDSLATHEYFHAWNVKQIRPKVLGPFDYSEPVFTDNLWFAEGVTDYYAYVTAYRSGLHDQAWLLARLSEQIAELQQSRNRLRVTLAESSRRAWENGGMGVGDLSYYTKGLVAGLLFDAWIRSKTEGAKSLDDVMRLMYSRYKLPKPGYDEDAILKTINEVSGHDCSQIYHRIVDTAEEMPYQLLEGLGLRLNGTALQRNSVGVDGSHKRLEEWLQRS